MPKQPTLTDVSSGFLSASTINNNNAEIETAFDNTLSRDGSSPNQMEADLDMNSNDILNVSSINTSSLQINGTPVTVTALSETQPADTFESRTAAAAATIDGSVEMVFTAGYANAGDGGAARYKSSSAGVTANYPASAWFQSADGGYWLLDHLTPNVYMFGAKGDASFSVGTKLATGTDDTTAFNDWVDFYTQRAEDNTISQMRYSVGRLVSGWGRFRVSGSVDLTFFGSASSANDDEAGDNRLALLDFAGCQVYADGPNKIVFDATDAEYITIENLAIVGIENSMPAVGIKIGRKNDTDGAAHNTLRNCTTRSATGMKSFFSKTALLNVAGENFLEIRCIWENYNTTNGTRAAVFDSANWFGYEDALTVTAVTNADPAVFTSTGHGLSDGDIIVIGDGWTGFTPLSTATAVTNQALTVANSTTNTFTVQFSDGSDVDGTAYSAFTSGTVHKETITSDYVTDFRATPYVYHSHLNNLHLHCHYAGFADYSVVVGWCENRQFISCFGQGDRLLYFISGDPGANLFGFRGCKFEFHHEQDTGSGGTTEVTGEFFTFNSATNIFLSDCLFYENAAECSVGFFRSSSGSYTIKILGGKISINRSKTGFANLFANAGNFHLINTEIIMDDLSKFNPNANQYCGRVTGTDNEIHFDVPTPPTELTIATGAVTATSQYHQIDTESDAASDDLDTINVPSSWPNGTRLTIRAQDSARTVVLKHNTGNLRCGSDRSLTHINDVAEFELVGSNLVLRFFADNTT